MYHPKHSSNSHDLARECSLQLQLGKNSHHTDVFKCGKLLKWFNTGRKTSNSMIGSREKASLVFLPDQSWPRKQRPQWSNWGAERWSQRGFGGPAALQLLLRSWQPSSNSGGNFKNTNRPMYEWSNQDLSVPALTPPQQQQTQKAEVVQSTCFLPHHRSIW